MLHLYTRNFIKFLNGKRYSRFLSEFYRTRGKKQHQTRDFGKRSRSKKDIGPPIPLPEVRGEIIWGIHPIQAVLCAGKRNIYTAFFKADVKNFRVNLLRTICEEKDVDTYEMADNTLDVLVGHHPHQGVCLDVSPFKIDPLCVEDMSSDTLIKPKGEPVVWMLPYRVKDTMNMGAILRSAHFLGVDRVLLPSSYSSGMNSVVSKASAGAMEIMDIRSLKNQRDLKDCLIKWKSLGGTVVGSTGDAKHEKVVPLREFCRDGPVLLIIGSESEGIGEYLTDVCDILLSIPSYQPPLYGEWPYNLDSLNVSVATGILLHGIMTNKPNQS